MPIASRPSTLPNLLSTGSPIILDGALATYLETLGADISGALWSADILHSNPSLIKRTHVDYYRAGANVAITASYQASIPGLVKHLGCKEEDAKEVVKRSVELAKEAREEYLASSGGEKGNVYVAGSVGPYGAYLADGSEYRGDYLVPKEKMKTFHRGRIEALVEAGVDLLACETMPSLSEVEALVGLLHDEFPNTEAWFSFTLRDSNHISDGAPISQVIKVLEEEKQVVAIGFNCVPDDVVLGALKESTKLTTKPLVVYPNSGEQWNAKARNWEGTRTGGSLLAKKTKEWWDAGARLIGGCCRTTPDDIEVIAKTLQACEK